MPGDRPEDPDFGPFWKRHRELDNMLSSAFMFMPERFRLPRNLRDSIAVQANLNFHAAVISLHNAAREKADKYKLPGIMQSSRTRALTAAHEIVDIMKVTGTLKAGYRGPLMAISLYLAASVFITQAKEDPDQFDKSNLELLIACMAAVGLKHVVSHAYLKQVLDDLERNGISAASDPIQSFQFVKHLCGHSIPLVARGAISRHTKMQTPLPGRLPLGEPQGVPSTFSEVPPVTCSGFVCPDPHSATDETDGPASKRMRTSAGPSPAVANYSGCPSTLLPSLWFAKGNEQTATSNARAPAASMFEDAGASSWTYTTRFTMPNLPDRTGSPAMNNQAGPPPPPTTRPPATAILPTLADFSSMPYPTGLDSAFATVGPSTTTTGFTPNPHTTAPPHNPINTNTNITTTLDDLSVFENLGEWGLTDPESLYSMLVDMSSDEFNGGCTDPWTQLTNAATAANNSTSSSSRRWDSGGDGGGGGWS